MLQQRCFLTYLHLAGSNLLTNLNCGGFLVVVDFFSMKTSLNVIDFLETVTMFSQSLPSFFWVATATVTTMLSWFGVHLFRFLRPSVL